MARGRPQDLARAVASARQPYPSRTAVTEALRAASDLYCIQLLDLLICL